MVDFYITIFLQFWCFLYFSTKHLFERCYFIIIYLLELLFKLTEVGDRYLLDVIVVSFLLIDS